MHVKGSKKHVLGNSRGIALLSVTVWAGIGTVMLLGVSQIISNTMKNANFTKAKVNQTILANIVEERVSNEATCQSSLTSTSSFAAGGNTDIRLNLGSGIGILQTGQELSQLNLRVVSAHLAKPDPARPNNVYNLGPRPGNAGQQIWRRDLRAVVAPITASVGPGFQEITMASVSVFVDASGTVQGCRPIENYPVAKCSIANRVYLPGGYTNPFPTENPGEGGGVFSADADGCVDINAFKGQEGIQGDVGPRGLTGPRGPTGPQGARGPRGPRGDHDVRGGCSTRRGWCTAVRCPSGGRPIRCRCFKTTTCRGGRNANWSGRRCGPIHGCRMRGNGCDIFLRLPSGINVSATSFLRCRF